MSILSLIIALALCGFVVWLILQIPMPEQFRKIIIGVVCVALVIWLLQQLGIITGIPTIRLK